MGEPGHGHGVGISGQELDRLRRHSDQPLLRALLLGMDNTSNGDEIMMSTSTDGGQTWGAAMTTAGQDFGIGGVPVVKPGGKVIVPILGFNGDVIAFNSTNGGKSWSKAVNVAADISHAEAGSLRSAGLISSGIDAGGRSM